MGSDVCLPFNCPQIRHRMETSPQSSTYCLWIILAKTSWNFSRLSPVKQKNSIENHNLPGISGPARTLYFSHFRINVGTVQNQGDFRSLPLWCLHTKTQLFIPLYSTSYLKYTVAFPLTKIFLFETIWDAKQIEQGTKTNSFSKIYGPSSVTSCTHCHHPGLLLRMQHGLQITKNCIHLSAMCDVAGRAQMLIF